MKRPDAKTMLQNIRTLLDAEAATLPKSPSSLRVKTAVREFDADFTNHVR